MSDDILYADIVLNEKSSAPKDNRLDAGREDAVIYAAVQFAGAPSVAPPKTKAASDTTTAGSEDAVIYAAVQFAGAPSAAPPKTKAATDTTTEDPTPPVSAAGKASSYRQPALVFLILCCLLLAAIISLAVYHFKDQEKYIVQLRNVSLFYGQLETNNHNLTSQNSRLNETYSELQSNYSRLNESQSNLQSNYSRLNETYSELQSNYSRLNESQSELQSNYSRLNTSLSKCKQENEKLSLKSSILDKYCPLPLNDSNCNLCPEKWMQFNGKCYYFSTDNMNWISSRDNCTSMGGHLVIIESKAEQDFLSNQSGIKEYWIGLNDQAIEGQWRWLDNTTLNPKETYWGKRPGGGQEPDNYTGSDPLGEDCVRFAKYENFTHGWHDSSCTKSSFQRICETVAAIIKP